MNKIHRTVWNAARGCLVVSHEKTKARGMPSSVRHSVLAVVAALATLGTGHALAVTSCDGSGAAQSVSGSDGQTCLLQTGDSLTVQASGSVVANGSAVRVTPNATVGGITNHGLISGTGGSAIAIYLNAVTAGVIDNRGTIVGSGSDATAIVIDSSTVAGVANSGTVSATDMGIHVTGGSVITGNVTNTSNGVISAGQYGVSMDGATVSGGIVNDGTIVATGGHGVYIRSNSLIQNGITNGGLISGQSRAVRVQTATVDGDIVNQSGGVIAGNSTGVAVWHNGTVTGSIINAGTITGAGSSGAGIKATGATLGGITNSGTITGTAGPGIYVTSASNVGAIVNQAAGTISGANAGIKVVGGPTVGTIANSGSISGQTLGIAIQTLSTVTGQITNSGHIQVSTGISNAAGIAILGATVTGGIANGGSITGSAGIVVGENTSGTTYSALVSGGITNSGAISGLAGVSVGQQAEVIGGVTNAGTMDVAAGVVVAGRVDNVSNSGAISGAGVFLLGGSISGDIVNTGSMVNSSPLVFGTGVGMLAAHATVDGAIVNEGTIAGVDVGIKAIATSTITGGLTNSGTVSGGSYAVYGDNTSSLSHIRITGNDTAKFIGEVYAPNTPVTVDGGAAYTMDNGQLFTVQSFTNAGTLKVGAGNTGTITGDFTNTGTFSPAVASMSSYGKLNVSGTATLGGALIANIVGTPTLTNGGTLAGVIHAGTIANTFSTVSGSNNLFTFTANYTATDVDLVIGAGTSGSGGSSGYLDAVNLAAATPAAGAAGVLDRVSASSHGTNPVVLAFANVPQAQVSNAVTQTLPLLTGNTAVASSGALTSINRVIQARVEANRGMSSGDQFYGDKKVWFKPFASWADQGDRGGVSGYKARVGGFAFGADAEINSQTRVGAAFAYANANVSSKSTIAPQAANVDIFQVIGYGSYSLDERTEANFQVDFGNNKNEGHRDIGFAGTRANAKYDSFTTHLAAGLSRSYALSEATTFIPSVRIDYTNIYDRAYRESGAGALNLNVNRRTSDELIYSVDGKVAHKLNDADAVMANLGFAYDAKAKASSVTAAYAGASDLSFTTTGATPSKNSIRAGFGYVHAPKVGPELMARYDVEVKQGFKNETVSAKVRWAF